MLPEPVAASFGMEKSQQGDCGVDALVAGHRSVRVAPVAGAQLEVDVGTKVLTEDLVRDAERVQVDIDFKGAQHVQDLLGSDHRDPGCEHVKGSEADAVDPRLRGALSSLCAMVAGPLWRE